MVMQAKPDQTLPTVAYEIDTVETLVKAMRTVYNLGLAHPNLSVKEDYEANKAKLLAGYFKVEGTEIVYLWDDNAPKVNLSFAEEVTLQNAHDFDTVVNYKAHGRSHKLEEGIAAEFEGKNCNINFVPVNNFDWKTGVGEILQRDLKEKAEEETPKKRKPGLLAVRRQARIVLTPAPLRLHPTSNRLLSEQRRWTDCKAK
jgi:hypothetical protein